MSAPYVPDLVLERRLSGRMLDVFIRAGLVFALAVLCYQIFSPFVGLMAWALILAVTIFPAHQKLARRLNGSQWLAATLIVVAGLVLIGVPTAMLMLQLGDSIHDLVGKMQGQSLKIPEPWPSVAGWPVVGERIHGFWQQAYTDLPSVIKNLQPKLGDFAKTALGIVASIGGALLMFFASFIIAAIIMAFGRAGAKSATSIAERIVGGGRGQEFAKLSTATIRAVALGVLGVAFIQAVVVGVIMIFAGIPFAGVLALLVLLLGIAQVPAVLVTLPVIAYIWIGGNYSVPAGITYSALLLVAGLLDNVLKPLLLGRGVEAPMVVILFGALGGMATSGLLGMFVGATLLALGYQIFIWWVASNPDQVEKPASKSAS
jgi:predicted PurR-regulated permease PerM